MRLFSLMIGNPVLICHTNPVMVAGVFGIALLYDARRISDNTRCGKYDAFPLIESDMSEQIIACRFEAMR